jgi:ABC-2 type transport system ATP-binding protein
MIKTSSITKRFGQKTAVNGVSLAVEKGEIFGFLGPNGAGKTTTIRMLMGILRPNAGSATIENLDVTSEAPDVKKIVGYLPDEPYLYDYLRGREFLEFLAEMHNLSQEEKQDRIPQLLSRFGLKDASEEFTVNYSHGMKKKLALCGALLHDPQVLIMDEPTSGLDPLAVRDFRNYVNMLAADGKTIFLSTHVLDLAEKLCNRVGIIHEGKLVGIGSAATLRSDIADRDASLEEIFINLIQVHNEKEKA